MKGKERPSKTGNPADWDETAAPPSRRKAVPFFKVLDARNQPIRGLWKRNDRYYARLTVGDPRTRKRQVRRVPLPNATTVAQARDALHELLNQRIEGTLPSTREAPAFNAYADAYLLHYEGMPGAKAKRTLECEKGHLNLWKAHFGAVRLNAITKTDIVDFNPDLEVHLRDMQTRRAPDSEWLFPSPQRGEHDRAAKTFTESLRIVRKLVGLPVFGFHDCRHFFISYCVMAGIDYMTIAKWVGHKDGGVLIGKVYGHLADEHAKMQAGRLTFGRPYQARTRWSTIPVPDGFRKTGTSRGDVPQNLFTTFLKSRTLRGTKW